MFADQKMNHSRRHTSHPDDETSLRLSHADDEAKLGRGSKGAGVKGDVMVIGVRACVQFVFYFQFLFLPHRSAPRLGLSRALISSSEMKSCFPFEWSEPGHWTGPRRDKSVNHP